MYKVLVNGALMCDSRIEELALINPVVDLEENKAGSFSFTIPPDHPKYDAVMRRKSVIQVIVDEEIKFCGPCIEAETDFFKRKKIYCEGELTFFNDSIQRPARYQNITVRGLLEALVANHNAQVEESKWFKVGIVTVTDPNNSLYCYTNMESTMTCMKEDLLDDLGGILRIRYENGERYIDYLAESPNTNSQVIKLGKNLLDFKSNIDSSDIATAIIPLGKTQETSEIEGLETKLTIKSVNNGVDYVYNQDAVGAYGMITKTVEFSDVTNPSILKTKGEQYLADIQFENVVIEAKAVDLHMVDKEIEGFKLSDRIRVLSEPHGMNRYFRATKQTFNLNNPASDTITLGKLEYVGLSAQTNQVATQSKAQSSAAVNQAVENASQIIANAMGGYVVKTNDEILIMDTNDIATATKVWRWNINGLGYSRNGYAGPYELAMTMDGAIVANMIKAGILQSTDGSNKWDLDNGLFTMKNGEIDMQGTVTKYASDYTQEDMDYVNRCTIGLEEPTIEDLEKYDMDGDGILTVSDVLRINRMLQGDGDWVINTSLKINPLSANNIIRTEGVAVGRIGITANTMTSQKCYSKSYRTYIEELNNYSSGATGEFTTADGQTVRFANGIIYAIL